MKSMTGYGRAEQRIDGLSFTVEMKSVNHRFCEISIKMPREFMFAEDKIKRLIQKKILRGRVDVFVNMDAETLPNQQLEVNWSLVEQYMSAIREFQQKYNLHDNISATDILAREDMIQLKEEQRNLEEAADFLLDVVSQAVDRLVEMRDLEGQALTEDLESRMTQIRQYIGNISQHSGRVVDIYREKILQRVKEFLGGQVELDEGKLLTEVALFAEKANIDEELTRLHSHCEQFLKVIRDKGAIGRKLDFLIQEMNREMNTIGSKANDLKISQWVVELKSELEKIKEQVQNIE
ncbi:YicC family protein [Microaerobacter geothermalis]|uniref:YicC/YloC family endoribonuclease n=1 Tax=Microaerobacter geothermalis TaxID=674972 RepID=UPI001F48034D|nr:YicC/YloC family endoribonuclease [Microaerobacter geothermalis]MCF6094878.1 YicC family protein [Microaerobacter geothermalis]